MCGRYTVFTEEEVIEMREIINEVNQRYINTPEHAAMKTGEIFPTNIAPVLALEKNALEAMLMNWGFPKWQGEGVIINARSETAMEKPMFRNSLGTRRCVIPSTGFYEWKHEGEKKKKDKYLIKLPGQSMLYMAGLYNTFKDKLGRPYTAYVILTAKANASMATLHDRMPVILAASQKEVWLSDYGAAMKIMIRANDAEFELRKVTA